MSEIPLRRILVPLDGSDFSFRAAEYAIKLAKMSRAEIVCVHAIINLPYDQFASGGLAVTQYIDASKSMAGQWYEQVKADATKQDVKVTGETILDVASPADSIVNYAERQNADLIVIGTKGKTGLKRFLLGSVASGVVTHAKCPVLVVR